MVLDNFRTIELIWDRANKSIIKTIKTASSDTTGRYLSVKILDGGQEVTLNNAKLQLYWEHPNFNTSGTDDFNTVNNGGLFKMTFSEEMLTNIGELNAYLVLTLTDGKITSDTFPIKVFKGADDGVVVPTNGKGLVDQVTNKIDKGNVTLSDLTQEVKLAMTGGSVAIVGENAVGTEEIKDGSVTAGKTNFITYGKNKFNPEATKDGVSLNSLGLESPDLGWSISEPMPVKQGETYTLTPKDSLFTYKRPAFFDTNKQFVSLIHSGTANYKINYTAPQDGYIIASVPTVNKHQFSMTVTSESDNFEPFIFVGAENLYVKPLQEDEDSAVAVDVSTFFENGFNLFEQGVLTKGKFINGLAPTTVQTSSAYNLYQNIPVVAGEILNYREFGTGKGMRFAIFYDDDGNFISDQDYGTTGFQQGELNVPEGAFKVSITVFEGDSNHVLSRNNEIVEGQSNYQLKKSHGVLIGNDANTNPLSTKRLLGFGDSINQGGGNVINGKGHSHIEMIAEDNNMSFTNYSVGGATVAPRDGYDNQIIKQINQAITANDNADFIVFNGLTNDASATPIDRIGEMTTGYTDALDLNTFAGSFEEICRSLKLNWLGAKIIYVRVHNMSSRGNQQVLYGEMAVKICKKYSIPIVDMYSEGGLNTQMIEMTNLYTNNADSTHPNDLGYRTFYVPRVRAEMLIG